ncbi:MAG TPA: glutamyl-tRNA amidotransferase, partial [Cupriavidus sp.]|nr:glutamyl-tRNA amidotransferase [Cupriavidus sp.]
MSESLCFLSATELADAIRHKRVSPVDITSAVLARAERLQPELNCFITLDAERAMESARQAERMVMAGEPL